MTCNDSAVPSAGGQQSEILPRHAQRLVSEALADTRVVLVNGARQAGKSTLLALAGQPLAATWRTLDDADVRRAAIEDPTGFVDVAGPVVIDEIQRVPELLLAIKARVDRDRRPGQFLLSGSARVLGLRALPDTLVGRMETIELWPFSQGEIEGGSDAFVDAVFAHGDQLAVGSAVSRAEYADRVVRGGFPESVARAAGRARERFLDAYLSDLVTRDVSQLSDIARLAEMQTLVRLVAARSGQLLVVNSLASDLGLPHSTVTRYVQLLEEVFLIKRIPAWSRNISTRATGTAKVAMVDSGLAANVLGMDAERLLLPSAPGYGPLLEGFVLMELARQLTWSRTRASLYHYRTKDQVEVDAVLENRRGQVVGIEVKAASTVRAEDFRGLRHLADRIGDDLLAGIVLYTGHETLSFGPKLRCMPISALWQAQP